MYGRHGRDDHARALRALAMARVGSEIREQRERRGMTLRALAHAIDVSPPFLSDVEHGRRSTKLLGEIERVLKLTSGSLWKVAGLCKHCGGTGLAESIAKQKGKARRARSRQGPWPELQIEARLRDLEERKKIGHEH